MEVKQEKKRNIKRKVTLSLLSVSLLGRAGGIVYLTRTRTKLDDEQKKILSEYELLKNEWLFGNEASALGDEALEGLLNGPASKRDDPYTFYTKNREDQGLSTDGKGFGFTSHSYDGGIYISEISLDSAAEKAGLVKGDVLYSVTSPSFYDFKQHTPDEISSYLKTFSSDQIVTFSGVHPNGTAFEVSRKKGNYSTRLVEVLDTPSSRNSQTLTVKVSTRLGSPTSALTAVLDTYGKGAKNLVLDFRGNGGGYLDQAASRASLFVKKGTLLYQRKNKDGTIIGEQYQKKDPAYHFDTYSIIQDSNTASASESFILARRAGTNAKIYGFKSYGKGIAQNFMTFSDGSVVRYTAAYVYGPERENETRYGEGKDEDSIRCIHKKGILPDVEFTLDYNFLSINWDLSSTTGISENGQKLFLSALNLINPSTPKSYSKTYHFDDAIQSYFDFVKDHYGLSEAFNDKGARDIALNQKWRKDTYDLYLDYYDKLTRRPYDR